MDKRDALRYQIAPLEMTPSEFRKAGGQLVERIAEFPCTLPRNGRIYSRIGTPVVRIRHLELGVLEALSGDS